MLFRPITLVFMLPALAAWGADLKLDQSADFIGARRALDAGLPNVARVKLERLLGRSDLSIPDRGRVLELDVESCLRSAQPADALRLLDLHEVPEEPFWRGQTRLQMGAFEEALQAFEACPQTSPYYKLAQLGMAHALTGQGRDAAARRAVKDLRDDQDEDIARHARLIFNELELDTDRAQVVLDRLSRETGGKDARVQYLRARAFFQLGDLQRAESILRDILGTSGIGRHAHDAATVLLAQVLAVKDPLAGLQTLVTFLNGFSSLPAIATTESDYWGETFTTLETLSRQPDIRSRLLTAALGWAADPTIPERHGHAHFLVAQLLHEDGRDAEAIGFLEALIQLHPRHPRTGDAIRLAMEIHGAQRSDARVLALSEQWRRDFGGGEESVVDFLSGLIRFSRGEYADAAVLFTKAADLDSDLIRRRRALYNAAVSALQAGQSALYLTLLSQLQQAGTGDPGDKDHPRDGATAADLKLDHALALAAKVDISSAENELNAFVEAPAHATHPRLAEAHIALAELRLLDVPPRVETAESALQAAAAAAPPDAVRERIDYVRIWLQEARQDLAAVTKEAEAFIGRWPGSARAAEIHMKLGEAYYRNQNFASARTNFELVVKNWPQSPYADSALYFAGKSAMAVATPEGINTAITLWEELADTDSPLAFDARVQQVFAKRRQGDNEQALKLLDTLLSEAPADRRVGLLGDKAELLLSLAKEKPANYAAASTLLDPAKLPANLPFVARARLSVLRALALKAQNLTNEALEACYDTVEAGFNPDAPVATPSEFEWFYRAGFLAIDYLEEQKQWEPAALLAERLGRTAGPLAKDASDKASRIRLQHFLWDGKK